MSNNDLKPSVFKIRYYLNYVAVFTIQYQYCYELN